MSRLDDELKRRSDIYTNWPEGAPICQDDYEWATMTGNYELDREDYADEAPARAMRYCRPCGADLSREGHAEWCENNEED